MNAKRILLALGAAAATALVGSVPAAYAGYPIKCSNNTAIVVDDASGDQMPFTGDGAIQKAVDYAEGSTSGTAGSGDSGSSGDTVIICKGTYHENVTVPVADTGHGGATTNDNLTIRSFDDTNEAVVIADDPAKPVFDIEAPGVVLGGPGLGITFSGPMTTGVQVGVPGLDPMYDTDDDVHLPEDCDPPEIGPNGPECPDHELAPFATTNVSIVGNRFKNIAVPENSDFTGIAVNNTNNTMVFRNLVTGAAVDGGQIAYGIRYGDTNYNSHVLGNEVSNLSQSGGDCGSSDLDVPTVGVVGVAFTTEALDALVYDTKITRLSASCTAEGVFSNAWGGLENDRNGQQVPVATDAVDNRIKDIHGAAGQSAGIAIAPVMPDYDNDDEDESAPSSFRVLANDIDNTEAAVAVLTAMAAYSYIRENDLDGDTFGVFSTAAAGVVDATNNWWGCQEGPASGKPACAKVTPNVTYNPWTKHHIDHAGAHAGEYAGHR